MQCYVLLTILVVLRHAVLTILAQHIMLCTACDTTLAVHVLNPPCDLPRPLYCYCAAAWETIRPYAESHGSTGPAGSQNAAQSLEAGFAALQTTPSSSRGPANPWSNAHPGSMQRLRVLNLQSCSHVFRQLAKWQEQQLGAAPATLHTSVASLDTSDGSISSSERVRPGLFRLEELRLSNLATISPHLPMLLVGQKLVRWTPDAPSPAASSSSRSNSSTSALPPWPLQHLSALHINCCMGVDEVSAVLSQLPCLRTFEASSCSDLWEVPAGVCDCTTLTQLKLPRTTLYCLPPTISKLQQLQVGMPAASILDGPARKVGTCVYWYIAAC